EKIVVTGLTADTYFVVEAGVKIDQNGNPLNPGRMTLLNIVAPQAVSFSFTNPIFADFRGDGISWSPGAPASTTQTLSFRIEDGDDD
ncbi:MAG TPA: hypothetical protein VJ124_07990, partial [Pyrinomonadaceae bacterium]|nr:hypothetical protein [Pyrinomonadaceae bacterium]